MIGQKEREKAMSGNDKVYVATCVDMGDSSDGRAHVLGVFRDRDSAVAAVNADMELYKTDMEGGYVESTFSIMGESEEKGCVWNVEECRLEN